VQRRIPRSGLVPEQNQEGAVSTGAVPKTSVATSASTSIINLTSDTSLIDTVDTSKENALAQTFASAVVTSFSSLLGAFNNSPGHIADVDQLLNEMSRLRATIRDLARERILAPPPASLPLRITRSSSVLDFPPPRTVVSAISSTSSQVTPGMVHPITTPSVQPLVNPSTPYENSLLGGIPVTLPPDIPSVSQSVPLSLPNMPRQAIPTIPLDKVVHIISKWPVRFKGDNTDKFTIHDFIYRIYSLTRSTLGGNFNALCDHVSILFEGKAATMFWRYHAQVYGLVQWDSLCQWLREEFRDRRTDYDVRELIRARKQKSNERFAVFLENVMLLVDKLQHPIPNHELVEILKRNLRPDIRKEILFLPISSISKLREYVSKHELLDEELSRSTTRPNAAGRQVAEVEFSSPDCSLGEPEAIEAFAVRNSPLSCWNCKQVGHRWDSCPSTEWHRFCWGCGLPDVVKPNCPKCSRVSKNASVPGPSSHRSPSQES